jgi:ribulose-5-phosphate 4-epimerase/fuculose-1-phosphate aldolase
MWLYGPSVITGTYLPVSVSTAGLAADARPSAEAAVHARIAAMTGAGAVMHVHTVASVAAGRPVGTA